MISLSVYSNAEVGKWILWHKKVSSEKKPAYSSRENENLVSLKKILEKFQILSIQ